MVKLLTYFKVGYFHGILRVTFCFNSSMLVDGCHKLLTTRSPKFSICKRSLFQLVALHFYFSKCGFFLINHKFSSFFILTNKNWDCSQNWRKSGHQKTHILGKRQLYRLYHLRGKMLSMGQTLIRCTLQNTRF